MEEILNKIYEYLAIYGPNIVAAVFILVIGRYAAKLIARRIDLVFGISYTDDIKMTKRILEELVSSGPQVLKDPAPVIAVAELADSSMNLVCRPWVKPKDYWDIYFNTLEKGKIELDKAGITIPFPQRDIHLHHKQVGVQTA